MIEIVWQYLEHWKLQGVVQSQDRKIFFTELRITADIWGKQLFGQLVNLLTAKNYKTAKLPNPECEAKPKDVTTQMKALDEYILMVLFVLLLIEFIFL